MAVAVAAAAIAADGWPLVRLPLLATRQTAVAMTLPVTLRWAAEEVRWLAHKQTLIMENNKNRGCSDLNAMVTLAKPNLLGHQLLPGNCFEPFRYWFIHLPFEVFGVHRHLRNIVLDHLGDCIRDF